MEIAFIFIIATLLAYANGANDNFKGVATLYGSGIVSYKKALFYTSITTFLGSLTALFLAQGLILTFSGKGIVSGDVLSQGYFFISMGFGAALTVLIATFLGFPISTTHSITGALVGVGLLASGGAVNFSVLWSKVFLPLLSSPIMAVVGAALLFPGFRLLCRSLGIKKTSCLCVGTKAQANINNRTPGALTLRKSLSLELSNTELCAQNFSAKSLEIRSDSTLNFFHFLSAGSVCFARGLNDTPKIAALLLAGSQMSTNISISAVALFILLGGLLNAKKVAETISKKITKMDGGEGFTANVITSFLVIGASKMGLPVSTTHVSCGSLFGIGAVTKKADFRVIAQVLGAWLITLPVAAIGGATFYYLANLFF